MKKMSLIIFYLVFLVSFTSCQEEIYLDEYTDYLEVVKKYSQEFKKEEVDSIQGMIDSFISRERLLSCVFCVEEGLLNGDILDYCRSNHRALIFLADRFFRGENNSLKPTFQTMFKEFYPEEYSSLLDSSNLPKAVEWKDMDKEYSLPMSKLFEKYIQVEFIEK